MRTPIFAVAVQVAVLLVAGAFAAAAVVAAHNHALMRMGLLP